jgi:hypothetical protein
MIVHYCYAIVGVYAIEYMLLCSHEYKELTLLYHYYHCSAMCQCMQLECSVCNYADMHVVSYVCVYYIVYVCILHVK